MNQKPPWIEHGSETAEHEDFLFGNAAGLEALKEVIEEALVKGQGLIQQSGIECLGVRLVENDPRKDASQSKFRERLTNAGCFLLLAFMAFVLFVGLRALRSVFE